MGSSVPLLELTLSWRTQSSGVNFVPPTEELFLALLVGEGLRVLYLIYCVSSNTLSQQKYITVIR